jgi:hypothetical protein
MAFSFIKQTKAFAAPANFLGFSSCSAYRFGLQKPNPSLFGSKTVSAERYIQPRELSSLFKPPLTCGGKIIQLPLWKYVLQLWRIIRKLGNLDLRL